MWFLLLSLSLIDMIPTLSVELIYNIKYIESTSIKKKSAFPLKVIKIIIISHTKTWENMSGKTYLRWIYEKVTLTGEDKPKKDSNQRTKTNITNTIHSSFNLFY